MPAVKKGVRRPTTQGANTAFSSFSFALLGKMLHTAGVRVLDNCRMGGIGHLAAEPAWFLARKRLQKLPEGGRFFVLLHHETSRPTNQALLDLWKRSFIVFDGQRANALFRRAGTAYPPLSVDIGLAPKHKERVDRAFTRERNMRHARMISDIQAWRHRFGKKLLSLPTSLIARGKKLFPRLGINANDWFVCLHASEISTNGSYAYELARRHTIEEYQALIKDIHRRGGKVVRMGDKHLAPAPADLPLIDYPLSDCKADWMDLVLIHECRYFVGTQSGLQLVAVLFGKPQLLTNILTWFQACVFDGDRYLPALYWDTQSQRHLALQKYVEYGMPLVHADPPASLIVIPNQDDDLVAAAHELEATLANERVAGPPPRLSVLWRNMLTWEDFGQRGDGEVCRSFLQKYHDILFSTSEDNVDAARGNGPSRRRPL